MAPTASQHTIDMPAPKSDRKYSHKYVEYLYTWETSRRLKKTVAGPQDSYQDPRAINGIPVSRKGRGLPPPDRKEAATKSFSKRHVANMSYVCSEGLLDMSRPQTADAVMQLQVDETRTRRVLRQSGRHNTSSLVGGGAVVAEEAPVLRPKRRPGSANPGHGLSTTMCRSLTFGEDPQQQEEEASAVRSRLLYSLLEELPSSPDSLLHHHMCDPKLVLPPPKFDATRIPAPSNTSCRMDERRCAFYDSLTSYARNKMRGEFGSMRVRSSASVRALAGVVC